MRSVLTMLLVALPGVAVAESYVPDVTVGEVDVLVVLDSAPTAAGARAALAAEIGGFVTRLEEAFPNEYEDTSALSLHLGFVTSDLGAGELCGPGDDARLRIESADCFTTATPYPWVIAETDAWGNVGRNFDGMTADAVRCAMPVTLDGCALQQPLRASVAALDGSTSFNAGFLRESAVLVVLYVTTQDDCSANADIFTADSTTRTCASEGWACTPDLGPTPQTHTGCVARDDAPRLDGISSTADHLRALKANPARIVVGVIRGADAPVEVVTGGTLAPSCGAGTDRAATPGLRLDALAAQLGGVTASVCGDLAAPLGDLVGAIEAANEASPWGDYDPPACDGGLGGGGDDDLGGAPAETPSGSAFGCDAGGGGGGLGVLLLLSLAAATARSGSRRDP